MKSWIWFNNCSSPVHSRTNSLAATLVIFTYGVLESRQSLSFLMISGNLPIYSRPSLSTAKHDMTLVAWTWSKIIPVLVRKCTCFDVSFLSFSPASSGAATSLLKMLSAMPTIISWSSLSMKGRGISFSV
uniref:Uncharacterized protein n=1 Tax=Oryza nivara TaxID=4536 RepID=A0A0E0H957_ORYNI